MILAPQIYVRRKMTILLVSELLVSPNLGNKYYALSYTYAQAVTNQCLSICFFLEEMVSYLTNTKPLLTIHFMHLFTKHLAQELTT